MLVTGAAGFIGYHLCDRLARLQGRPGLRLVRLDLARRLPGVSMELSEIEIWGDQGIP